MRRKQRKGKNGEGNKHNNLSEMIFNKKKIPLRFFRYVCSYIATFLFTNYYCFSNFPSKILALFLDQCYLSHLHFLDYFLLLYYFSSCIFCDKNWVHIGDEVGCVLNATLHKKCSFPLRISSVNMTKSAEKCGFGLIYRRNP